MAIIQASELRNQGDIDTETIVISYPDIIPKDKIEDRVSKNPTPGELFQWRKAVENEKKRVVRNQLRFSRSSNLVWKEQMQTLIKLHRSKQVVEGYTVSEEEEEEDKTCWDKFTGFWKDLGSSIVRGWKNFSNIKDKNPLFREAIKDVESTFGAGEGAVFRFYRTIVSIHIFSAILFFSVIMCPTFFTDSFTRLFEAIKNSNIKYFLAPQYDILDTASFYAAYDASYTIHDNTYHMDLAMSLIIFIFLIITFFVCLGAISSAAAFDGGASVAEGQKMTIKTGISREEIRRWALIEASFSKKLFTGWNHSQASKRGSEATNKQNSIILHDTSVGLRLGAGRLTGGDRYRFVRMGRNFLGVLSILCLLVLFVWSITSLQNIDSLSASVVALFIQAINTITPPLVKMIVDKVEMLEYESTKMIHEVLFTLTIQIVNLFLTLLELKRTIDGDDSWSDEEKLAFRSCPANIVGSQMWQLVLTDTIMSVVMRIVVPFVLTYLIGMPEKSFEVSDFFVSAVYSFVLTTIGVIFAPGLAIVNMLCSIVTFYLSKAQIMLFCCRADKPWGAGSLNKFFSGLFSLIFLIMLIPIAYCMAVKLDCGPHDGVGYMQTLKNFMSEVDLGFTISSTITGEATDTELTLEGLLNVVLSPLIIGIFALIFGVMLSIYKNHNTAIIKTLSDLLVEDDKLKREVMKNIKEIKRLHIRLGEDHWQDELQ
ncbi:Transmembrane channel-like protein like protein [Aduncisulcus paluster]|uniref:Transmembrane channel-like protein like protein n=1 Tax=Aduncisulcus paluster TaxID=2918883 RepID=A0ABQ5K7A1_9EUKA|nr:Transmembrane channel-like protein like protein [Aduncisulcus paluster]